MEIETQEGSLSGNPEPQEPVAQREAQNPNAGTSSDPSGIAEPKEQEPRLRYIMAYEEGEPFRDYWDRVSEADRTRLLQQLQGYVTEMRSIKGTFIAEWLSNSAKPENDLEFVIGHIVHPWFFRDKRVYFNADRGPFKSSCDLMLAKTDMQIEYIKHLSLNPGDDYHNEIDESFAKHAKDLLEPAAG
ncbi:hypothetical protein BJX76DRAFT_355122 [Aspergillus varians]